MANYTKYGEDDYVFGFDDPDVATIATAVGMKPQTLSVSGEPEFTAEATNIDGITDSYVVADKKFTFTMNGFVTDIDKLEAGGDFTYKGRLYIVTGSKLDAANKDFQKGEVTGVSFPLITGLAS